MRPAFRIQPDQHQSRPDAHHTEAQGQAGTCHSPQGEAEIGHNEADEGQAYIRPAHQVVMPYVYSVFPHPQPAARNVLGNCDERQFARSGSQFWRASALSEIRQGQ
jgi:hypothetical protein